METKTMEKETIIVTAMSEILARYGRAAILTGSPTILWHAYDPCKAVQPIATVAVPGIWHCKERVFLHTICDGDPAAISE